MKNATYLLIGSVILIALLHNAAPVPLHYPNSSKVNVTDNYHGVIVSDPYRWLEDDNSIQTKAWVEKQNAFTNSYLRRIPFRRKIEKRLTELWDYPSYGTPFKKGNRVYFYKNDGLQDQSVLYVREDTDSEPKVFLDPNKFSGDGTVSLGGTYFSNDNSYMGYAIQSAGSDWREFYILNVETGELLEDHLEWLKFSGMSWSGEGFYYNAFPRPLPGEEMSGSNKNSKVFYHRLGTRQVDDELIFFDPKTPHVSPYPATTDDGRFLILYRSKGTYGQSLAVKDLSIPDSDFIQIVDDYDSETSIIDNVGNLLIAITDRNSPNRKVVSIDINDPNESSWKTIVKETDMVLSGANIVGGKIFAHYMVDVVSEWSIYDLNGNRIGEVDLPGAGISSGFGGRIDQMVTWYSFQSLIRPPTIYQYDIESGISKIYQESMAKFDSDLFVLKQEFYTSRDGTKVPIFISHKKGLQIDGNRPTLLYAYGGFNIPIRPYFNKTLSILLENDGVYALSNLRGGGEYGEEWHKAGMLNNKQNVFDDFIAGAEYLIGRGYTSSEKLAIRGGSNGGLLIGAVLNQRPDLFKVAFPEVGVMDMLRYEQFTIGWAWAVEYGSVKEEDHFNNLYQYSPLHNIGQGVNYPSVLIYTADHDDRVVPAHSFKYAAQLQNSQEGDSPILIRIGISAGHGAGKPTKKRIEEYAEKWAFMFYEMGLDI
jgi:prolyl oligopeptidase|tara:strand:- start:6695 stop:8809 length:2115 start_codon:yes stop_codon:yes gene_type:complete